MVPLYRRGSQLIFIADHKGSKPIQRYMSKGQMNTIVLCVSLHFDKGLIRMIGGSDLACGLSVEKHCVIVWLF